MPYVILFAYQPLFKTQVALKKEYALVSSYQAQMSFYYC